jgi:hypothetical protein
MSSQYVIDLFSLSNISFVVLAICSLWLLKVIIKKQGEILFRVSLIFIIAFLVFILFHRSQIGQWTFPEIKQALFPEKIPTVKYQTEIGSAFGEMRRRYIFEEPRPKLILSLDRTGKYFHLKRISRLNAILKILDLPSVKHGVQELASITGLQTDVRLYRWDDYPQGILLLEIELCQDRKSLESFHCLVSLTIKNRNK